MKKCCFTFLACPLRVNYNCSACVKSRIVLWFVPSLKKKRKGEQKRKASAKSNCSTYLEGVQHRRWMFSNSFFLDVNRGINYNARRNKMEIYVAILQEFRLQ